MNDDGDTTPASSDTLHDSEELHEQIAREIADSNAPDWFKSDFGQYWAQPDAPAYERIAQSFLDLQTTTSDFASSAVDYATTQTKLPGILSSVVIAAFQENRSRVRPLLNEQEEEVTPQQSGAQALVRHQRDQKKNPNAERRVIRRVIEDAIIPDIRDYVKRYF